MLNRRPNDSRKLSRLSVMMMAASAILLAWKFCDIALSPIFFLRSVVVENGHAAVRAAEVARLVSQFNSANLLAVDISSVRIAFEELPGVRVAEVFRDLPGRLRVRVEPQIPLARLSGGGLVNLHGEKFIGESAEPLPIFRGPESRVAEMAEFYHRANHLLKPIGIGVAQLTLSDGGAWKIFTREGWVINLGESEIGGRLARFANLYPQLRGRIAAARYFDLRYPRGVAVGGLVAYSGGKQQ